jgi:hypothetical protein
MRVTHQLRAVKGLVRNGKKGDTVMTHPWRPQRKGYTRTQVKSNIARGTS